MQRKFLISSIKLNILINIIIQLVVIVIVGVNGREAIFEIFNGKIRIDKFLLNCPETRQHKYPLYYENITVFGQSGKLSIDYDIVNNVYVKAPLSLRVDIQRCQNRENPDSCIKFANFKTTRLCNLLESTKEFWSPMITCARPKMGCPMSKGIYRGRNCTLDMSNFNWFPLGDSYWKLKVQLALQGNAVACGLVEGQYTKH